MRRKGADETCNGLLKQHQFSTERAYAATIYLLRCRPFCVKNGEAPASCLGRCVSAIGSTAIYAPTDRDDPFGAADAPLCLLRSRRKGGDVASRRDLWDNVPECGDQRRAIDPN